MDKSPKKYTLNRKYLDKFFVQERDLKQLYFRNNLKISGNVLFGDYKLVTRDFFANITIENQDLSFLIYLWRSPSKDFFKFETRRGLRLKTNFIQSTKIICPLADEAGYRCLNTRTLYYFLNLQVAITLYLERGRPSSRN